MANRVTGFLANFFTSGLLSRGMAGNPSPQRPLAEVYRYSGLGCMLAAAVILATAGGWLLDRGVGSFPVFTIVGALAGAALGTLSIYRQLIGRRRP
jgi:hypothetical protein